MFSLLKSGLAAITIAAVLAGCSPTQESINKDLPQATLKATEFCILNETDTPVELRWASANMHTDGDKIAPYAITRDNSGKVCGLGSSGPGGWDIVANVGIMSIQLTNQALDWPAGEVRFYAEDGSQICETEYVSFKTQSTSANQFCGDTRAHLQRLPDTDYKNFLLTISQTDSYTPSRFK